MKTLASIALLFIATTLVAHPGIGLVEDSKGNVYYTDLKQVWKISGGKKSIAVPNVHTHELYLDENDNLFGEHLWYNGDAQNTWGHFVWKLSNDGKYSKIIKDKEGFLENYSFVSDHFGRKYWADRTKKCQHIVRKNPDNTTTYLNKDCLNEIRWITSTDHGMIYLMDEDKLKQVDQQGTVKTISNTFDKKSTVKSEFYGVTVDSENAIYVADLSNRCVNRIDRNGTVTEVFSSGPAWSPASLVVARNGDYLVLEVNTKNEVQVERVAKDLPGQAGRTVY